MIISPLEALEKHFGLTEFRPAQLEVIENLLAGKNTLATLPTGSGKSLTFQLPAFLLPGTVIVVSPLLSLIRDQVQKLDSQGIAVSQIDSTLTDKQRIENLASIADGEVKLVYTSPETLASKDLLDVLKSIQISVIAIDEAHCYSEWGHSFRPSYLSLPLLCRSLKPHALLALTATATRKVASDIRKAFKVKVAEHIAISPTRDNLSYHVLPCLSEVRDNQLVSLLSKPNHLPAVVYAMRQEQCEEIAGKLSKQGFNARSYHAGMSNDPRKKVQDAFINDEVDVIVATIAFGMGVDKSNIRSIIHYHLPKSPEGWLQESGRAGRDGLDAHAYLLACGDDIIPLTNFIRARELKESTIRSLLDTISSQGKTAAIQPYKTRVDLEILSSTLDVLLAKLELTKLIRYSHTSWRYVTMWQIFGRSFDLNDYPKSHRKALEYIIKNSEGPKQEYYRYDLEQSREDFNIAPEKLYQTLEDIKQSGEYRVRFSGWRKHYKILKNVSKDELREISQKLYEYHQQQLADGEERLKEVLRIATTKACIPAQFEKWFSVPPAKRNKACGKCSSCLEEFRPRKLPRKKETEINEQHLEEIQALLVKKGRRLNTPQKLTRFLCGIPTPYNRHFYLYKHPSFGLLEDCSYDEVLAQSIALL